MNKFSKMLLVDVNDDLLKNLDLPLERREPATLSDEERLWLMAIFDDYNTAFDEEEGPLMYYYLDYVFASDLLKALSSLLPSLRDAADEKLDAFEVLMVVLNAQI